MAAAKPKLIKYWLPVLGCMGLIFYASSLEGRDIPPLFPFQDIVFHLAAYSALGFSFSRALKNSYTDITLSKLIVFTIIFGTIYGISDEWHQAFVPYRTVSGLDVFIDGVGAFLGSLIQLYLFPLRRWKEVFPLRRWKEV